MAVAGSLDNESGLFSNSSNVSSSTSANTTGWTEFCERHARASEFALGYKLKLMIMIM